MRYVESAGHRMAWQSFGSGEAVALAVHCSLGHGAMWAKLAARFEGRMRWICPDMIGHGSSDKWDGRADLTAAIACGVEAVLAQAGGPVHLIGHSFGAAVALVAAIRQPGLIRSVTFFEPMLPLMAQDRPDWEAMNNANAPFRAAYVAGDIEQAARLFVTRWGTGRRWEEMSPRARARAVDDIHMIEGQRPGINDDSCGILAPGALARLAVPVTLVQGAESPPMIAAMIEGFAERLADVQVVTVPGAGHMVPVTHPDESEAVIRATVERAEAPTA